VVTSPPYWALRDYGVEGQFGLEKTPEEYIAKMVAVFHEVRRVLRSDGTLWLNIGDSYASDPGKGGSGTYNGNNGHGEAYARERLKGDKDPKRGDTANGKPYRAVRAEGIKAKDLVGIPWMLAFALRSDGWYLRQDIIWAKPNPMPESVTDRCTKSHEYLFLLTKSARYYYDAEAIKEDCTADHLAGNHSHKGLTAYEAGDERHRTKQGLVAFAQRTRLDMEGPNSRMHQDRDPAHPATRKVRSPAGWKTGNGAHGSIHEDGREQEVTYVDTDSTKRNKRSVWTIATQAYSEAHFATFPEALVEPCILAGSKEGDTVLEPFCGSGTTGVVALRYHRDFVGIELNPTYAGLAQKRIGEESPMFNQVEVQQSAPTVR
jgi:site-specific DNA-methyltransferase (cytosine-N4-specific)